MARAVLLERIPLNDLVGLHAPIEEQLKTVAAEVISSGRFINGSTVTEFEAKLARFLDTDPHRVVGCSSGTDAILMALMAAGIGRESRVAVPTFTFGAPAIGIARVGATPIFVDVDSESMNVTADRLDELDIDAVIPVHLFGRCVEMSAVTRLAAERNWVVIEDAAQAIGSTTGSRYAATWGDFGCFSFFPTKNLGALGDAGAVVARTDDGAETLRRIRHHGCQQKYVHQRLGGNFRIDAMQAALLSVKIDHLESWNARRAEIARIYLGHEPEPGHSYHRFVIQCADRKRARARFDEAGIDTAVYYPTPLHRTPLFNTNDDLPVATQLSETALAIPIFPSMTSAQIERVKHVLDSIDATF